MRTRGAAAGAAIRRAGGLTMLEWLLSLSLTAAVVAAAAGLVRTAMLAAALTETQLEATQAARRAIERVIEELRWAEAVADDPLCPPTQLCPTRVTVRIPPGNPYRQHLGYQVIFQHNSRQREIERRVGAGVNNLAANIEGVTFTYLTATGALAAAPADVARIRISIEVRHRRGAGLTVGSEVGLRNRRAILPTPAP